MAADGSCVVGKHDGTGGEVSIGTVTSQLLYEIGSPAYLGPDVTARFDTIELEQLGRDRVRVSGTLGEPPPPTLKVAMNEWGGYRNDVSVALTGLDIEAKAELIEAAFWEACPSKPSDFASVTARLVRTDKDDPASNEEAVAQWRLTLKDPDERKVGRAIFDATVELGLATIPGFFSYGGSSTEARPYGVYRPAVVPADLVPQHVVLLGGRPHRGRLRRPARHHVDRGSTRSRPRRRPPAPRFGPHSDASSGRARATRAATPTSVCSPAPTRHGRGSTVSSPSTRCAACCPRRPISRYSGTGCRRSGRSTS